MRSISALRASAAASRAAARSSSSFLRFACEIAHATAIRHRLEGDEAQEKEQCHGAIIQLCTSVSEICCKRASSRLRSSSYIFKIWDMCAYWVSSRAGNWTFGQLSWRLNAYVISLVVELGVEFKFLCAVVARATS